MIEEVFEMRTSFVSIATLVMSFILIPGCDSDDEGGAGAAGTSGSAGTAGSAGSGGTSGTGGASGSSGTSGSGGSSGTGGAGTGGTGGTAGSGGTAGTAGTGGSGGGSGGTDGGVASSMSFFITSSGSGTSGGNLGGLAGADAKCQSLAAAVGLGGKTWRAYLSINSNNPQPSESARTRIGTGPWFNAAGVKIADTVEQLHEEGGATNNLNAQTGLDEQGQPVPGRDNRPAGVLNQHDILTGSGPDGRALAGTPPPNCENWTSNAASGAVAQVGHHDRVGLGANAASWNAAHTVSGCSEDQLRGTGGAGRLYCFAID